ncbi:ArsR family transcriptional regulator [Geothermobacter ehrlichii]|uniref:ArsR family transcriptional regulator n=1 Tax=Geothermobacter ehrlichii TaxID=213224 RepID=A0A5D3WPL7_9BACT|nr:metalloregulator ArsR/SmtB family transcription factor [Geothermobacter ehrlichii]TYO99348.1 ArsR family transcriptional regulator [Geothermobacter ehrlichii]
MDSRWADKFKVLADPNRLAVIGELLQGEFCAGELSERLEIEPTLLSHHLKVLREAGFVTSRREGKMIRYSLAEGLSCSVDGRALDLGCCQITFRK